MSYNNYQSDKYSKYESLFSNYKNQKYYKYFAEIPEEAFEILAEEAKEETWDFKDKPSKYFPVLRSYLNYTFKRLCEQDKIVYCSNEYKACFNTGLQTKHEDDIYLIFEKNTNKYQADWIFEKMTDKEDEIKEFDNPQLATYIEDVNDLVFDLTYTIHPDSKHIIDQNNSRLPSYLQGEDNKKLASKTIKGIVFELEKQLRRNYRLAIPHWYNGRIQLLLPGKANSDFAEFAFVLEKDTYKKKYYIKTILEVEKAYSNARVICNLETDWLHGSIQQIY